MAKENVAKEIRARIDELLEKHEAEIRDAEDKIAKYDAEVEKADADMKAATVGDDLAAYDTAKTRKREARSGAEMYRARLNMIRSREIVDEAESDKVIDRLLDYERELTAKYEAEIREPLALIEKLTTDYRASIGEAERVIDRWTFDIHANHRTFGLTTYKDGSTRSPEPVRVHRTPYTGCVVAAITDEYVTKVNNKV